MELGLAALYNKQNPYEKRAQITGQVASNSGFAKPFLAYAMGKDLAQGEQWDTNRNAQVDTYLTQNMDLQRNKQQQEYATEVFKRVVEISKHDPVAATQILKKEAEGNPLLAPMKDISFNAKTTKDDWATITGGDGQAYQVYLPGLAEVQKDPQNAELKKKYIVPIGNPKDPKGDKTIGNVNPTDFTPESMDKYNASGKYSDLVLIDKKAGAEKEKTAKEFRQYQGQLDGLYKAKASVQKGYDPISGQVIPQTQIEDALKTINEKIFDKENYMKNVFPDEWKHYKPQLGLKDTAQPPEGAASQLKSPGGAGMRQLYGPKDTAPAPAPSTGKTLDQATASQILKEAGGDKNKAREIARQRGYAF